MDLQKFSLAQERAVKHAAFKLRYLFETRLLSVDMESAAQERINRDPLLKGVSAQELLKEVLFPGSFSNTAG